MIKKLKETSKWTFGGYILGFSMAFVMSIRYAWSYKDYSALVIWVYIGVSICAFAWIYNKLLDLTKLIQKNKETMDSNFNTQGEEIDKLNGKKI